MSSGSHGFDELLEKWNDDPAFVAEGIALDLSISLNKRLEQLEMTRKELAERVQVSPGRISQIMAGNINLTLLSICKVALAVGLRPSLNLADGETTKTPYFAGYVTAGAAIVPAIPGSVNPATFYSTTMPMAQGSATFVGGVDAPSLSLRTANEGLATTGQQRPGEAA